MAKTHKQITLAQNFLRSSRLVRSLLETCSIEAGDIVYEIGPGRGIITAELAQIAGKVIAIEKDPLLARQLRKRFRDAGNVEVITGDFLQYRISHREYKLIANIPYNITADLVRKILYVPPVPGEAYLIMQKEAAGKFSGSPYETQFSILAKPFFDLRIMRALRRTDFVPVPHVDSVFLYIQKRPVCLVREEDRRLYCSFIRYAFGRWKNNLKLIFKPVFTYQQWKRLSKDLQFPLEAIPSKLSLEQWLGFFECFKQRVPLNKQACVR